MPDKNSQNNISNNISIPQKYLDNIIKMRQDQDVATQQAFELLRMQLSQTNALLSDLIKVSGSGSTVASSKKIVPFHTGSQEVGQLIRPPSNPDDYPTRIDVYAINSNRTIPHMTLINDGPGDIFFINAYAKDVFNEREGHLNVNDQRELFNVYEVRLRSTLPLTTVRLIEGIFRTGSTAPNTAINIIQKPTIQTNQLLKQFVIRFDLLNVPITINSPEPRNFPVNDILGITNQPPLPPGQTAALVDVATNVQMPFTIPEGIALESYSIVVNMTTDYTIRAYLEFFTTPATSTIPIFSRVPVLPGSARGAPINQILNISTPFSIAAPLPGTEGRRFLVTITNDDPFNNMIGIFSFVVILSRVT